MRRALPLLFVVALVAGCGGGDEQAARDRAAAADAKAKRLERELGALKAREKAEKRRAEKRRRERRARLRRQRQQPATVQQEQSPPQQRTGQNSQPQHQQPGQRNNSGKVPCTYGEGLCTPEQNQRESDIESYCGPYDPSRVQPDGSYKPKPGC